MGFSESVQDGLAGIMKWSARRAWAVIAVVSLISMGSVGVLLMVEPNVETDIQSGYFATHDEQANFFRELREDVAGVNSEIVYFELKGNAQFNGEAVDNVTSIPALNAQEELFEYVKKEFAERAGTDKVISHTSLPYFYKLINKQSIDPQTSFDQQEPTGCFCVPQDPVTHGLVGNLLDAADSTGAIALYRSDDYRAAVMFIIYDPDTSVMSKKATGGLINEIIEDYRALPAKAGSDKEYDLWQEPYFDSWGVQSWIYRIDEQVQKESVIFIGAVFAFLAVTLLILFRNMKRAAIGVTTVALILTWTLAGMTLFDVSIGFVSMAMFPLLLGVGVDYVIHIINEFGTERSHVESSEEAFDLIGRRGAVALMISTLTTISGFLVMITSTSPMIVEIATATILGIFSIFMLSITFLPALLQLSVRNEAKEVFRPSNAVGNVAVFFGRNKAFTITILVIGTIVLGSYIPKTEYVVGTVEINLPQKELWTHKEDKAHMLAMYERFQETINASGQETIITKAREPGGLATKGAVDDMIAIHKAMAANEFVQESSGGAVNSVPFILNLYALLKDGVVSAGPGVGEGVIMGGQFFPCEPPEGFPPELLEQLPAQCFAGADPDYDTDFGLIQDWTDADVKNAYDDMLAREEWKPLLLTFMDESYSIAWALTFVNIEINEKATLIADKALRDVLTEADPQHTDNHYFGTLSAVKKYNDYTDKWLTLSSAASLMIVALLVYIFSRSWRAVAATVTPMMVTFIWWLGALPTAAVDIDLAFIFMIPIAFITSLGSDYAVHLTWNLEKNPDSRFVFKTVGKAVAYSSFTTAVAFLFFTRGAIRGSYEMFEAAVIAIVLMAIVTFLTIPLFYIKRGDAN